jgi:hypothetical protein
MSTRRIEREQALGIGHLQTGVRRALLVSSARCPVPAPIDKHGRPLRRPCLRCDSVVIAWAGLAWVPRLSGYPGSPSRVALGSWTRATAVCSAIAHCPLPTTHCASPSGRVAEEVRERERGRGSRGVATGAHAAGAGAASSRPASGRATSRGTTSIGPTRGGASGATGDRATGGRATSRAATRAGAARGRPGGATGRVGPAGRRAAGAGAGGRTARTRTGHGRLPVQGTGKGPGVRTVRRTRAASGRWRCGDRRPGASCAPGVALWSRCRTRDAKRPCRACGADRPQRR